MLRVLGFNEINDSVWIQDILRRFPYEGCFKGGDFWAYMEFLPYQILFLVLCKLLYIDFVGKSIWGILFLL